MRTDTCTMGIRQIIIQLLKALRPVFKLGLPGLFLNSCSDVSDNANVRQAIPIVLNKSITVELRSLREPDYPIGICCSSEIWQTITNGPNPIRATLNFSASDQTELYGVGSNESDGINVADFHYLFMIGGKGDASVTITFPNSLPNNINAQIVVKRALSQFP